MDICHSSPAWVGYGSQGSVRKTARPGYISRADVGTAETSRSMQLLSYGMGLKSDHKTF